jgi:tRNA uridine 5-carboxymethylaminomethyl modification enzyme
MINFDIIIVGGGHAGLEAAWISSQFKNLKIAIITLPGVGIASAPCNPSIGGVGKGQVVRELDALGGITGKLADMAGIQFRTLNESKGYAVQSTRIQIDKEKYPQFAEDEINKVSNITLIKEKVMGISQEANRFIITTENNVWNSKKLIITVGTFLNGKMHTGSQQTVGGRVNTDSSESLSKFFNDIKTVSARFKTGTPAILNINSINYDLLDEQKSDPEVSNFHCLNSYNSRNLEQVSCYLARTNSKTMSIIRDNKEKSPMYNGQIKGVGARYCPSIEDKANRYPDKDVHHVFVEPEGLNVNTVYPSGISSSLPQDIQDKFLKTIVGLEKCHVEQYGYAVEYDVIDTTLLNYKLEYKDKLGLFFAGQVNGTSGYEEAAAQGYIAGVNAALELSGMPELVLNRRDSYIGVMIEDLISNTRDEPYRLFTARNENRLSVREDNSVLRMCTYREQLFLNTPIDRYNRQFVGMYEDLMELIEENMIKPNDPFLTYKSIKIPKRITLNEFLKVSSLDSVITLKEYLEFYKIKVPREVSRCVAISAKYMGYINKAVNHYEKLSKMDKLKINWEMICESHNVSFECKQRIKKIKPGTFGQLKLIEGLRPATLAVVAGRTL